MTKKEREALARGARVHRTLEAGTLTTRGLQVPTDSEAAFYIHCPRCLASVPPRQSPREWARLQTGITVRDGTPVLDVTCTRHDCLVARYRLHPDDVGALMCAGCGPAKEEP